MTRCWHWESLTRGILRALDDENTKLDPRDRVTIDSIRNHTSRHFPVQQIARATYREILERRAEQNQVDFVQGVATAITPMAFLETVMVNGYETLVDPYTKVDVNTGMIAAGRLQSLIDSRADQSDLLQMRLQFRRILDAVRSTVPQEMWARSPTSWTSRSSTMRSMLRHRISTTTRTLRSHRVRRGRG
jgi:hypothetical protein